MRGGGAERVSALVASGFATRGHDVDLVLNRAEGPHLAFVRSDGAHGVARLQHGGGFRHPSLVTCVRPGHPVSSPRSSTTTSTPHLLRRLTGTPIAATVHGVMSVHRHNLRTSGVIGTIAQAASPLIYRLVDAIGVVSEAVERDIAYAAKRPDKFHVLHNPVDTDHFSPLCREGDAALTRLPNDDGSPIVLAVGRFDRAKNFHLLIEALARVQERARLVLLGEGVERNRLEALARSLGVADRVHMPGFVTDPAPWYRRAAVHAVASELRGLRQHDHRGAGDRNGRGDRRLRRRPAELLGHGRYGTIVPAGDNAAMAAALTAAIRHKPDPPPLIARAQDFSLEACLDRYEAMIEAIEGRKRHG